VWRRNRRVIRLGDRVEVQVAKVDSFKKQVDFRLAQQSDHKSNPRYRGKESKRVIRFGSKAKLQWMALIRLRKTRVFLEFGRKSRFG
jgi:predicted RNA-binding protein with RPS1 domain